MKPGKTLKHPLTPYPVTYPFNQTLLIVAAKFGTKFNKLIKQNLITNIL